jgi:hypothetical protein
MIESEMLKFLERRKALFVNFIVLLGLFIKSFLIEIPLQIKLMRQNFQFKKFSTLNQFSVQIINELLQKRKLPIIKSLTIKTNPFRTIVLLIKNLFVDFNWTNFLNKINNSVFHNFLFFFFKFVSWMVNLKLDFSWVLESKWLHIFR